jgi:hypothetical protein
LINPFVDPENRIVVDASEHAGQGSWRGRHLFNSTNAHAKIRKPALFRGQTIPVISLRGGRWTYQKLRLFPTKIRETRLSLETT